MPDPGALLVPIMFSVAQRSWPRWGALAKPVPYLPLSVALTRHFPHDAHTAAYSSPHLPRRLSRDALSPESKSRLPGGVSMMLAIFDGDCPASHRASGGTGEAAAPDEWWAAERPQLQALLYEHPNLYIYRTKGGLRIIGLLPEPYVLREPVDAAAWSLLYLRWCAYLARRFELQVDPSCKDWQRLYRLPHATRTAGGYAEERDTLGNPHRIGLWHCTPTAEDIHLAQTLHKRRPDNARRPRRSTPPSVGVRGGGILFHAFDARGWLGHEIERGKWSIICPWEHEHTKGRRFDSSTVLFEAGEGDTYGWPHCSHAHCQHRGLRTFLTIFTPDELDRARVAAGLPPYPPEPTPTTPPPRDDAPLVTLPIRPYRGYRSGLLRRPGKGVSPG
jgi:hypothetical protein